MEDPKNVQPDTDDQTQQETSEPVATVLQPSQTAPLQRSKKSVLFVILALLLIVGGVSALFLTGRHKASAPAANTTVRSDGQQVPRIQSYFYYVSGPKSVTTYNTDTKAKATISLTAGPDESVSAGSTSTNRSVQFSKNGAALAYATVAEKDCGEGGCAATDSFLYFKNGDKADQIAKVSQPRSIDDWVISSDGTTIHYLVTNSSSKANGSELHKISLADKKDTLIKQDVFGGVPAGNKTPLLLVGNELRVYLSESGSVKEYAYANGKVTSKSMNTAAFCADCRVEYGAPLSPDGTSLILESGTVDGIFSYYLLNTASGAGKQIMKTVHTEQPISVFWSPDGKSIAYDIAANGNAGQSKVGLKFRFDMLDVATGKITSGPVDPSIGIGDKNYAKHFVNLMGWSPDSDKIAYLNENTIKFYNVSDANVVTSDFTVENPLASNVAYGWYKK